MKLPKLTALIMAGALAVSVAACGKPTVDSSDKRYKANKDKMSVLITKQPANKAEFEKKLAEFEAEYKTAMEAGSDEEKIKKLGELNSRMDKYIAQFDKKDEKKGGATAPSGKLDKNAGAAGAPPAGGTAPAPATGGKLGGAPAAGTAPAGSGGMGGGAPAGGTAPAGSGGMGGGAPAGGTAPAQPASGGMGGM